MISERLLSQNVREYREYLQTIAFDVRGCYKERDPITSGPLRNALTRSSMRHSHLEARSRMI